MTLVVSDLSKHGIAMVGDSAVTFMGPPKRAYPKASKIHYCESANAGIALWGNAYFAGIQLDQWIGEFQGRFREDAIGFEEFAELLAEDALRLSSQDDRQWEDKAFGIHVAGYINGIPRLWHIHCGHRHETPHEPRLYRDFPEDKGWTERQFEALLNCDRPRVPIHLRNGYTPYYGLLFENMYRYSQQLYHYMGVKLPQESLMGSIEFHKSLIKFVAGALVAAGEHPGVNDELSYIGFYKDGVVDYKCREIVDWSSGETADALMEAVF